MDSPSLPIGLCRLPPDSEQVLDADEEVFSLYTDLQLRSQSESDSSFRGLGHVDSHKDVLLVKFELAESSSVADSHQNTGRSRKKRVSRSEKRVKTMDMEVQIAQDKTALRSRKGDTGSVVWKASIDFARQVLQHAYFPTHDVWSLFDYVKLKEAHVLELGSGTGLLGVLLSPLVQKYTVTDIEDLIPLIQKNLVLNSRGNSNVDATPLDWLALEKATSQMRSRNFSFDPVDLLLIVDCIYHPSLLPAFLETIDYLTTQSVTTVLIVVELRAEDVIREFLEGWLAIPSWKIWRVGGGDGGWMGRPYVLWIGMK
ncbi:Ribosomal protein lysine methyltransferase [Stygiomarasmius scandens]|uniref:Ribosomal protein lysine methyltransferase n=1 Tax=Marasmiellus scandens TaxID=2682957 RepID=A0ABR1JXY1_9AGAR